MVSIKLMYVLLPLLFFLESSNCEDQECQYVGQEATDIQDLGQVAGTYKLMGTILTSSTDENIMDSKGLNIAKFDVCATEITLELDAESPNVLKFKYPYNERDSVQITFPELPKGYGKLGTNIQQPMVSDYIPRDIPVKFLESTDWQIVSFCLSSKKLGINDITMVQFFLKKETPVEEDSFIKKLDEILAANHFKVTMAFNLCSKPPMQVPDGNM